MQEKQAIKSSPLLEVSHLAVHFPVNGKGLFKRQVGSVRAVEDVSFSISHGETFGLVGESGCGKTTLGHAILQLHDLVGGKVLFDGQDLGKLSKKELRTARKDIQLIFQDPYSSLDQRMTVEQIVGEPFMIHKTCGKKERREKVLELLDVVGMPSYTLDRYASEFSGGQRQRIGIARALALRPKFIICDEPVSALDVSIQSQVLNLIMDLQKEFNLTYLFIAHGLSVVKHVSDNIGVMYLGRLVEISAKKQLYANPLHPYTEALLSAAPIPDPTVERSRIVLRGDVPSPIKMRTGCSFKFRCKYAEEMGDICKEKLPELVEIMEGHHVACHRYDGQAGNHLGKV
ncbi:MAG: ATP-binding cassette domain-containing protein [Puniceicoccales bacterium]|jgi:oligopeptide/dipeptide ABC transporter ATP-binding protein|nr:ATP-binding cassette domain-containing protein [Puniceicoccales bacterium]